MRIRLNARPIFYPALAIGLSACSVGGQYGYSDSIGTKPAATDDKSTISCTIKGSGQTQTAQDFFPWPPPRGSAEDDLTARVTAALLRKQRAPIHLADVDRYLVERLKSVGYNNLTYYTTPTPNSYAAVAQLEPIDSNGHRLSDTPQETSEEHGQIAQFFLGLTTRPKLPKGRFRLFVFFVTTERIQEKFTPGAVTTQQAKLWVSNGCTALPSELSGHVLAAKQKIILRVYEMVSEGDESHVLPQADALTIPQHFAALGLKLGD